MERTFLLSFMLLNIFLISIIECASISNVEEPFYEAQYLNDTREEKPAMYYGSGRPGVVTRKHRCGSISAVPADVRRDLSLNHFYQKYTHAYGIPIIGSHRISDDALKRACYVVRFLFADNKYVRQSYYSMYGRFALMASTEVTTDIPEHANLGAWWNGRARGLGATPDRPVSTAGEENALCWQPYTRDKYYQEDIVIHEYAHGMHLLGLAYKVSGFEARIDYLYKSARSRGLWANTYSLSTNREYFAVGVQAYFNAGKYLAVANGVHGPNGATRSGLKNHDPSLYNLVVAQFPCKNEYIKRCDTTRAKEMNQRLRLDCQDGGTGILEGDDDDDGDDGGDDGDDNNECVDKEANCGHWNTQGYCTNAEYTDYMKIYCKKTCNECDVMPPIPTKGPTTTKKDDGDGTGDCEDTNTKENCDYWELQGHCDSGEWDEYMKINCAKTCKMCDVMPPIPTTGKPTTTKKDDGDDSGDCEDTNTKENCDYWELQGHCDSGEWDDYMKIHCAKTCNMCDVMPPIPTTKAPPTTKKDDDECLDVNENCESWMQKGQCLNETFTEFMQINCNKTCKLCDVVTTTDITPTDCDDNVDCCGDFAKSGFCTLYQSFMNQECKKSCGKCGGPGPVTTKKPGVCKDDNTSCEAWANNGECEKNPDYMLESCKKSCQEC